MDYAMASYLHVHTWTHRPIPCQIPDELNMHLTKSPQKKSCVQIKPQQINAMMHFDSHPGKQQPTLMFILMDFPLRKPNFWALPALVLSSSGPARVPLSTGRETQCREQTTTDKQHAGSPALRLQSSSVLPAKRTQLGVIYV